MTLKRATILILGLAAGIVWPAAAAVVPQNSQDGQNRIEVRLEPKVPGDSGSLRWSPKGEKLALTEFSGGWETVLKLGPAEAPPVRILLAKSPGAAHFDTLVLDRNGNGEFADETPLITKPSETRGKFWSSFEAVIEVPFTGPDGRAVRNAYPVNFWYVEDPMAETQERILRYSRSGWMEGAFRTGGAEAIEGFVLLTESRMDGVFDREDAWSLAPAAEHKSLFESDNSFSCAGHAWLEEKAWRLVEIHPSGRKIVIEPFNPGLTRAEEIAKADTMAADRNAPRSGKTVAFGHDFEAAEKEARTRGVALFIDFETTWCGPCKSMDQWVYTADEVVAAAGNLVAVKVDGDVRRDVVKRFSVQAYPTLVLVSPTGTVLKKVTGYASVKETVAFLKMK
ncbi:MAG: thioredoxin family protein [Candidatus Aminicenantes bacterium]|nr:thioredoxin family protein [Candidatus Aminicenantes bacterium]